MQSLDRLLDLIEQQIDFNRCLEVDQLYCRALAGEPVERPPLVVQWPFGQRMRLPAPWDAFPFFPYAQAFDDPVAMMQNQLLQFVAPGLLLGDESPLAIRNNHGTLQIAALLGAAWTIEDDNPPWVRPLDSLALIEAVAKGKSGVDYENGGLLPRTFQTLQFYQRKLDERPACRQAIQIALPDLQGPIDTADQLWGGGLFVALYEQPDLVGCLLQRIVDTMLAVIQRLRPLTRDRLDPVANAQHGWVIPGRLLIRDDAAIMLSPKMYTNQVLPHDARLLQETGGGSIHFCGNGHHLIEQMTHINDLKGFDIGQPEVMDVHRLYQQTRHRRLASTPFRPRREDLISGKARHEFPTGVVLAYQTTDFDDAKEVIERYKRA